MNIHEAIARGLVQELKLPRNYGFRVAFEGFHWIVQILAIPGMNVVEHRMRFILCPDRIIVHRLGYNDESVEYEHPDMIERLQDILDDGGLS